MVMAMVTIVLPACGGSSESESGDYDETDTSSESLSDYAGKWVLFEVGDEPTESASCTLKISASGNVSINYSASKLGYGDVCMEDGDGYAELSGDELYIRITSGKSNGKVFRVYAKGGRIYSHDGREFQKKMF